MKHWHNDIEAHIEKWSNTLTNRSWWPRFVYHFTDIRNACEILRSGELLSRAEAMQRNAMKSDNASQDVIANTKAAYTNFARLYFRPRTPTQYHNEGIRPWAQRSMGAHCPVPVFFAFDALSVLTHDDTEVSDGNMARKDTQHSGSREFFAALRFDEIFHAGSFPAGHKDTIINHRHAEILIPQKLSLQPHLRFIVCRSSAERQTFLHLLTTDVRQTWEPKIRIDPAAMFERSWTYVEEVIALDELPGIRFRFSPSINPSLFQTTFEYQPFGGNSVLKWQGAWDCSQRALTMKLPEAASGIARLQLDDSLAFHSATYFTDIPF